MLWIRETGRAAVVGLALTLTLAGCSEAPPTRKSLRVTSFVPKADPTYTITLQSYAEVGRTVEQHHVHKETRVVRVKDAEGKELKAENATRENELLFRETVLTPGEDQPRKLKRFFTKAVEKDATSEKVHPYEGRTIIYDLKGNQYEATAEGEPPLPGPELAKLAQRITRHEHRTALLPREPVKVGDSWPIDIPRFAKMLPGGLELELPHCKGAVKLVRIDDSTGQVFGVMELQLNLAVRKLFDLEFNPSAQLELKGTLQAALATGSTAATLETTGTFKGTAVRPDKGSIDILMEMNGKEVRSAQK